MTYEIGHIVDIQVTEESSIKFKEGKKPRFIPMEGSSYLIEGAKVTDTFGTIIRLDLVGREIDIHDKFLQINKQFYRDERLKRLLTHF